jgi:predicted lipoprotein with Yx(FWY)xxD motif
MLPIHLTRWLPSRPGPALLAAVPLAATIALAGCGGSSRTSSDTATRAHTMTHTTAMQHTMGGDTHAMPAFAHAQLSVYGSEYGRVIFDQNHTALYTFSADLGTTSTCYGACQAAWPPLLTTGTPRVAAGLNPALIGTTKRRNGALQVTYAGHPVYFYSGDKGTNIGCQHVKLHGGYWYVLNSNGTPNLARGHAMM